MFEYAFDRIYVFSAEQETERQEYIREHFNELNITNWEFHYSRDLRNISNNDIKVLKDYGYISDRDNANILTPEISTGIGLLFLVKKWIERNHDRVLFVQDDIEIFNNFRVMYSEMFHYIPKYWDSLHFYSHSYHGCGDDIDSNRKDYNKFFKIGYNEGHGSNVMCAWRKSTFSDLMSRMLPVYTAIDGTMNMTTIMPWNQKFSGYVSNPFLCRPNPKFKSIYSKYKNEVL